MRTEECQISDLWQGPVRHGSEATEHYRSERGSEPFSGTSPPSPATGGRMFPAFQTVSWRISTLVIYHLNTFGNLTSYD